MIKVKVYAKVNISLLINGVNNGFHMLDSVVASASIADVVAVQKSEQDCVVTSAKIESIENKIYALIQYMRSLYGFPCLSVEVENNIPLGGGLGGSLGSLGGSAISDANCKEKWLIDSISKHRKSILKNDRLRNREYE
jgi:4-diphosphocytidyl-2C-methyl-D-erythritol kinase